MQLDRTCADASATGHVGRILVVPSEVAGAGTVFARVGVRRPVDWYLVFSAAWRAHRRLSPARGRANSESREVFSLQDCKSHREASYNLWTRTGAGPWTPARDAMLWGTQVRHRSKKLS